MIVKKYIFQIFQIFGTVLYSTISGYLIWFLFHWITPYLMNVNWFLFLVYIIFVGGIITAIMANICQFLMIPLIYLTKKNIFAKVLNVLPMLYFGYHAILFPWANTKNYGILQYIIGISITCLILVAIGCMVVGPFKLKDAFD